MNPVLKSLVVTTLISSCILLTSGCSKKTVVAPNGISTAGTELSGGTDINYPSANISDNDINNGLADEEPMDSGGQVLGNLSINSGDAEQTNEYKRQHGRSSIVFSPIYFSFDQAGINTDMRPILASNADYMKDSPNTVIVIEGNCDERGTNEYNLALGERRAINAREYMINLGVEPARIRTVSYGEERSLFTGQDERDWAQNRRADFIVE